MSATIEQLRNATTPLATYVGKAGQLVLNTDDWSIRAMDGSTAGGLMATGHRVNAQTGTSYATVVGDQGRLITLSNGSPVAVTIPQAGMANNLPTGARLRFLNRGAGAVTLTPTTSTINGATTLVLPTNWGALVVSDGTNYLAVCKPASPLGNETVSRVPVGSAVSLTTGTPANVTSVVLGPGLWEVSGAVGFSEGGATVATEEIAAINTVSATLPTFPAAGTAPTTGLGSIVALAPCRITVASGTTTVYLIAQAAFTVSTDAAYGEIRAVRVG